MVNSFDICFLESTYSWSISSSASSAETSTWRHSANFPVPVEECLLPFRTKSLRIDVLRLTILVNDFDAVFGHTHGDADSTRRAIFEIEVFILFSICFSAWSSRSSNCWLGKDSRRRKEEELLRRRIQLSVPVCSILCCVCRVSRLFTTSPRPFAVRNAFTILLKFKNSSDMKKNKA